MQFLAKSLFIICLWLTVSSSKAAGVICRFGNNRYVANTLYVGKYHSQFKTLQSAIDSIPENNDQWIKIQISPGCYQEQITIPINKPCIVLEGHGSATRISYYAHERTDLSATFSAFADNIIAKYITFENSYNLGVLERLNLTQQQIDLAASTSKNPLIQAVAARIYGDKSAFYACSFIGVQDTLWDVQGRHLFSNCYIQGAVDFIFGNGQSIYERCTLNYTGGYIGPGAGYVTAQGRESASEATGFVFRRGMVTGTGQAYLGRAYRPYSRVIFIATWFSSIVTPAGWNEWQYKGEERNLVFGEMGCQGPGSETSGRVWWAKNSISNIGRALRQFSIKAFINQDGWLDNLPG